jgi:hypothetical protein
MEMETATVGRLKRDLTSLSWLSIIFSCAIAFVGCDSADYTIVRNVTSPDSALSALLVQRRGHDALSSDVYYVLLLDSHDVTPNLPRAIHDKPILVATHAQGLVLEWSGPRKIDLICDGCGITKIDVIERNEKRDSVDVGYVGFPI